jgi:tRNA threonylcarbamoyladenosine biosynthesis protein TsaB
MQTPRAHSKELLPMLSNLLAEQRVSWQDIQAFAVGVGPGSFTGLRVACATIAGINASLKKPVYALSSLAITARQVDTDTRFWVIEDARSGLVYAAQYEHDVCLIEPCCMTWDDFLALAPARYISLSAIPVALDSWQALPINISREQALVQAVSSIADDAQAQMWVEPLYLQASQAEKNLA